MPRQSRRLALPRTQIPLPLSSSDVMTKMLRATEMNVSLQMSQEVDVIYHQLMDRIAMSDDVDVAKLFREDRQPLKSPTDKDKRRNDRVDIEQQFIDVSCILFVLYSL